MVEADLVEQIETFQPGVDRVRLTATDGETWRSRRLSKITGAHVTLNTNTDADVNVTFSGNTATMNLAGVTDDTVTLTLIGEM